MRVTHITNYSHACELYLSDFIVTTVNDELHLEQVGGRGCTYKGRDRYGLAKSKIKISGKKEVEVKND